ncbi:MAG: hypothetical protein K6E58_00220 [Eubacterium sp.]|nr:hypothetical protein [Eubacterium sp.]
MQRIELIKMHLHKIVDNCDRKDIFKLLFYLQGLDITYGYAVATLQAFEDSKIGMCSYQKLSDTLRKGEYDRLFDEWLNEEI